MCGGQCLRDEKSRALITGGWKKEEDPLAR